MRPKATTVQRRKAIQKKNKTHWLSHKYRILSQREEKQTNNPIQRFYLDTFEPGITEYSNEPVQLSVDENASETSLNTAENDEYSFNDWEEFVGPNDNSNSSGMNQFEDEQSINDDSINEESFVAEGETIDPSQSIPDQRSIDELDICVALLLLKKRHRCSINLLDDIIRLLKALKVANVPSSWHRLKRIIRQTKRGEKEQTSIESTLFFCSECHQQSANSNTCINAHCSNNQSGSTSLHCFIVMNIEKQIEHVLRSINIDDLNLTFVSDWNKSSEMADVQHGNIYRNIVYSLRNQNRKLFITLTCNIDGAALYTSSEQSMWTFTACINELRRSIRFNMENMIVLGISVGRKKPSKCIMQMMLKPIVHRMKDLETPRLYRISSTDVQLLRVYLIGISNDKPANSLVQNLSEPNAQYGCSKCEIAGRTTPSRISATPLQSKPMIKTVWIRIFPTSKGQPPQLRSNQRWNEISHALNNGYRFVTKEKKTHTFGYLGECQLTELAFIDRGSSFMSDTLHSIYHGAFKKLLEQWTERSKKQPWSLTGKLTVIDSDLKNIHYPRTTSRTPRSIVKCLKLKANESRTLLLIAYPIFRKYLPEANYQHLQKLAFGMSIGESSLISAEQLEKMELLLDSFVDDFPYDSRYVVQTVHCVKHFAQTVKDFGPLSNYSTFNFESVIGYLSSSVHGTRQIGGELVSNHDLFKRACHLSNDHCDSSPLSPLIEYIKTGKEFLGKGKRSGEDITEEDFNRINSSFAGSKVITCMKTIVHRGLRLSTLSSSKTSMFTNACIVYQHNCSINYGIIQKIFHLEDKELVLLKTIPLINKHYDELVFKSRRFFNENLIYGELSGNQTDLILASNVIEKACLYYGNDQQCYIARFPNLYESS